MIQRSSSSDRDSRTHAQAFLGMSIVAPFSKGCPASFGVEYSAAIQTVEGFVHPQVPADRNTRANGHLLGTKARLPDPVAGPTLMKTLPPSENE